MAMKRCKECGTEISSSAKVCPKCGKEQRNFFQKHIVLTVILVLIVFGVIGSQISDNSSNDTIITSGDSSQSISNGDKQENKITLEKFNQIQTGMTYEEVVAIIGEDGTVISDVDIGQTQYKTTVYYWYAKNGISNANVTFQGGKVVAKAQVGLN